MLLELGERYWALGLPSAARSALARALAAGETRAASVLAELALAQGDPHAARELAAESVKRAPGPAAKILLGRAQLAAGEVAAARMSFAQALDAPRLAPWDRARAHLELSRAAGAIGDVAGAAANAAEAFRAAVAAASTAVLGMAPIHRTDPPPEVDPDATTGRHRVMTESFAVHPGSLDLVEEIATAVVAAGRTADAAEALDGAAAKGERGLSVLAASVLAARQAAGEREVTDAVIDNALAGERSSAAIRLRRLERRARTKETLSVADREVLLAEAELLASSIDDTALSASDRARVCFLHASLCESDPATRADAEAAYRKGLAFQPGHTGAACKLALLVLARGDQAGALAEIERALRIDASHGLAWRNAARMLAQAPSLSQVVGRLLDAANPGAGSAAAPRLVSATAEVARHDALAGVHAHGHRVKNLLGIIGSRARSARKQAGGELQERLRELEKDVTALYEEWAQYLRSMQAPTPTVELVGIAPLVQDVVAAARARAPHVMIALEVGAVPDVRGDRILLREALLNIVTNAAEACGGSAPVPVSGIHRVPGEVSVKVRAVATATAPLVEVTITDGGPGISRAALGRLFVPGFTTKETGSGVGLAIAERVVAAHHGRITIDSEEGRGTTVTVTLPTDKLELLPMWSAP